ncbi:MAG: PP2C family protein-serine/threonine phosphatase [Eubacteriales bacterium]|jgi:serine/threonine protein phosphatase PrpC
MRLFKRREKIPKKVTADATTVPVKVHNVRLSYIVENLQGIGSRPRQEDSFAVLNATDVRLILDQGLFAVVADGMGGMQDGQLASTRAVEVLTAAFRQLDHHGNIGEQLCEAALSASAEVLGVCDGSGGSTCVCTLLFDERLYWCSVGDSAILLRRGDGLYRLNRSHTYYNQLLLDAVTDSADAYAHPGIDRDAIDADPDGVRLTSFLGMDPPGEVEFSRRPLPLMDGDTLLLCSDGVEGVLGEDTLYDLLSLSPHAACDAICNHIEDLASPSQDNYTAILIAVRQ